MLRRVRKRANTQKIAYFFSETHSGILLYSVGSFFKEEYKKILENSKYNPKVYF